MSDDAKENAVYIIGAIALAWLGLEYDSVFCGIGAVILIMSVN